MKKLREVIQEAVDNKVALGHFNISNLEGLWAIFRAAKELKQPVIIGVSEGERDFVGVRQVRALVSSIRDEFDYPIYLNADHTYSFERVKEVIDAGFDAVIFDGSQLSLEENIKITRQCVDYARSVNPDILVEGELGYIGTSSKLLDEIPEGAAVTEDTITTAEDAKRFVAETGVDLLAPAVGNIHGMLKSSPDPRLHIDRIKAIREAGGVPLVLHGGSGTVDEDFTSAIKAGVAIVHINTELRVAYRDGLKRSLQEYPDEIAPYKILKEAMLGMKEVTAKRLKLFNQS
ncbi:MAG: class II fructose-bisphosphate aldolase [Candidatus Vogelbacteria bacterium]|nr:class II fructose-bisphosphate aldolase [Candidatus Vogelbacteria bacterium]